MYIFRRLCIAMLAMAVNVCKGQCFNVYVHIVNNCNLYIIVVFNKYIIQFINNLVLYSVWLRGAAPIKQWLCGWWMALVAYSGHEHNTVCVCVQWSFLSPLFVYFRKTFSVSRCNLHLVFSCQVTPFKFVNFAYFSQHLVRWRRRNIFNKWLLCRTLSKTRLQRKQNIFSLRLHIFITVELA